MRNAYNATSFSAWRTILDSGNYTSVLDGRYVNVTGDTMTGTLTAPNVPSKILTATLTTSAGAAHYIVNDTTDTVALAAGKIIIISPNSTPSSSSRVYINYNNTGYKAAYDSRNGSLTYFRCRAGWKICLRYDGTYWRALYTPDSQWPLAVNKTTSASKYYFIGNTATGSVNTNTCYSCNTIYFVPSTGSIYASKIYNAVWNDYAEFRKADTVEPGRVVIEEAFGNMKMSTERLQPGGSVISDTYGHAMGETKMCKTPIAVAGRVLAYPYEDISEYQAGDAVCTGPNGTVSKMTREEIIQWPDRIVGIVSEIPDYEVWGSGNVRVNNRIWIKVR